jgi:hypothetical protein
VQYVLETLYRWQKLGVWRKGYELVRDKRAGLAGVAINLRDNMFIVARKR